MGSSSAFPTTASVESIAERRLRRLSAFPQPYRKYIAGLTSCGPVVEDLADSFPALLFALATGFGSARQRQAAFEAVVAGRALRDAAGLLGVPLWLRRLPPQALTQPLPELPADEELAIAAATRMPPDPREAAIWFERTLVAYRLVGREMALWVLREPRLLPPHTSDEDLQWLLAWAWASEHPDFAGHTLLRGCWSAAIGWKRARDEVAIWRKRIDLVGALAGGPRHSWLADGTHHGFEIVGLRSVGDFIAESIAMENCLDQYGAHLAYGRVRIFSVRKEGRPVADVEVTLKADDVSAPCISQIRGHRNRRASPAVWQAVHAWIGAQPFRAIDTAPTTAQATRAAFRRFWAPYVAAAEAAGLPPHLLARVLGKDSRRARPEPAARDAHPVDAGEVYEEPFISIGSRPPEGGPLPGTGLPQGDRPGAPAAHAPRALRVAR
jgi:hypothetical protein